MRVELGFDPTFDWCVDGAAGDTAQHSEGADSEGDSGLSRRLSSILREAEAQVTDRFIIIERAGQHFMQCLYEDSGWLLEKREGSAESHWRAMVRVADEPAREAASIAERILRPARQPLLLLSFEQVLEAMAGYLAFQPEPAWLDWARIEV